MVNSANYVAHGHTHWAYSPVMVLVTVMVNCPCPEWVTALTVPLQLLLPLLTWAS